MLSVYSALTFAVRRWFSCLDGSEIFLLAATEVSRQTKGAIMPNHFNFLHTKISLSASSSCYKVGTQMGRSYRLCFLLEDLNLLCASQERPPWYVFLFYPFLPLQIIEYSFFIKGLNEWSSNQNVWQRNKGIQISVLPDKENYYAKTGFQRNISLH